MMYTYNHKTKYTQDIPCSFKDFELTFVGTRHQDHPIFKPGFLFYDFTLATKEQTQTISWTSGTGDIIPVYFEINQQKFSLELGMADNFGILANDELVISKLD